MHRPSLKEKNVKVLVLINFLFYYNATLICKYVKLDINPLY